MTTIHHGFVLRQLTTSRKQSIVFVLCVALALISLVALRGFGESVNRALLRDAKTLNAADIIVASNFPLAQPVLTKIAQLQQTGAVMSARTYQFLSVARVANGEETELCDLKVVDEGYPFYGQVTLASGRPFHTVLTPGNIIVAQALLDRLKLKLGDQLQIGEAKLTIRDVVLQEPDRPVNLFGFGLRVFINSADLEALQLIKPGSRVSYRVLLKVNDENKLNALAAQLKTVIAPQENVETYLTARSGVERFFNNFLFFLNLVGIFTLLLAGIGIQSALTAFLRERNTTIAVIKTLGATNKFVSVNFLAAVAILGGMGALLGISGGLLLQNVFPVLLRGLLPPNVQLTISARSLVESLLLGLVIVGSFTFLPIYQLEELKPSFIFRKEVTRLRHGLPFYLILLLILGFFIGMVLWQLRDQLQTGLYFVLGLIGLLAIASLLTYGTLFLLRRTQIRSLALRQALRGLFRPRNATHAIVITLSAALAVIFCIYLLERNLDEAFVESYPPDAPNLFFIDIQANQLADFSKMLPVQTPYYPVVRASIMAVNGEQIDRAVEDRRRGDNLARQFNLTYRDQLAEGEVIKAGGTLFQPNWQGDDAQVSIADELLEVRNFQLGDHISFRIEGVPVEATITSIRSRPKESMQPFFQFVFPTDVLKDAPQSIFTALHLPPEQIHALQNKVVAAFPNISVIDATQAIANLAAVANRLAQVIRFFTLFSVLAGVLIVISSVFATRMARIQEAAYYKVLGATSRFVLTVFTTENLLLGLVSALLALFMAQTGAWILCQWFFKIAYHPAVEASLLMLVLTMLLVTGVGMAASLSILRSKPITYLREQASEE